MRMIKAFGAVCTALGISACSGEKVIDDYDQGSCMYDTGLQVGYITDKTSGVEQATKLVNPTSVIGHSDAYQGDTSATLMAFAGIGRASEEWSKIVVYPSGNESVQEPHCTLETDNGKRRIYTHAIKVEFPRPGDLEV